MPAVGTTVLVVEDEPSVRDLLCLALETPRRRLLAANTRADALALASADEIDLLLTDVLLPDGTGVELAETLRRTRPGLRVIYISGAYDQADFPAIGSDLLLVKPFSIHGLRDAVATVLGDEP